MATNQSLLKKELESRLAALQLRLESIKRDASRAHSGDWVEQAQERENDEVVDAIGNETAQSVRAIQAALARISAGSYGICDQCGEGIDCARLQVVPEATRCVACAR